MLPLTQLLAKEYMNRNIDAEVTISGGGSVTGISALINGVTDIAESARTLSKEENLKFKKAGKPIIETIVAYDALAIIVNPSNPVSELSVSNLEAIFTGKITNWKELGGADKPMVIYSRQKSSGTYDFFKEHVLSGKEFSSAALLMPATGAIAQSVSQDEWAIGYVGLAYLDNTVKALKISGNENNIFTAPSVESVKNKSYPISRPLFYLFAENSKAAVGPFVDFVLSPTGQHLVLKAGYVPVK